MDDYKWLDRPEDTREGEELNEERLLSFLQEGLKIDDDNIKVSQFSKGYSNLTYLIEFGGKEYVLRRPPFGANVKSGHNMFREYRILSALHGSYNKSPQPFLYTKDENIIGAEFYIMERVHGVILRANMPDDMTPSTDLMHSISKSMISSMVELHGLDYKSIGLEELGRPAGYTERQVSGWTRRFDNAKTSEQKSIDYLASWLSEHIPPENKASLIHNDYKYDNLVLDANDWTNVNAVLDWEMATLGDPLMDLGTTLGYWINHNDPEWMKKLSLSPTTIPGNPTREELVQMYATQSGREISNPVFYYVYGLFKIAGITQQIYYRYKHGHTKDKRFANLDKMVEALGSIGMQAIKKERLDNLF